MDLRKYQVDILSSLTEYLDKLREKDEELANYHEFLKSQGKPPANRNTAEEAWREISKEIYFTRTDGRGNSIPHVCIKVPTGGGKTLLATHAVKQINQQYFRQNTGLILWVVPSQAIYTQTLKAFKNVAHPYRQVLDHAAPRKRAKILERVNIFSPRDVLQDLAVMLLMTQASARQDKETLRMFRDNGGYMDFFPSSNDHKKHEQLLAEYPNLDFHQGVGAAKNLKYSLANVIKLLRPIIVLDEGHTAKSLARRETFNQFNPRFILELSATPPQEYSNVLVDVPGEALKNEEMIKLPIKLVGNASAGWQHTLSASCEKLKELAKQAATYRSNGGRYIRPILLVRVENTGREQRGKGTIHAEDVREYLTKELGFRQEEVRLKSSETDEISHEELLSPTCPVRVVITKDALKEGWDCPFAYVLALLDRTRSLTTLTQIIGRVLRQPYAELTNLDDLDMCHIFCLDEDVAKLVANIKASLNNHGLGDLVERSVLAASEQPQELEISRRERFKELDVFRPQVFYTTKDGTRPLRYERDILAELDWASIKCSLDDSFIFGQDEKQTRVMIDLNVATSTETTLAEVDGEVSAEFFARNLADLIPNPWQAMRIVREIWPEIHKKGTPKEIYKARMYLVGQLREQVSAQKEDLAQKAFVRKIQNKEISFALDAEGTAWQLPKVVNQKYINYPKYLRSKNAEEFQNSLFDKYLEKDFNEFEKKVAGYLDAEQAINWWHRVAARKEYGLQGWRQHLIYPDFIAFIDKDGGEPLILETKGKHLAGNEDTNYKKRLLDILEKNYLGDIRVSGIAGKITLRIIA